MNDKQRDTPPPKPGTERPTKDNEVSLIDLIDQHIEASKQEKR